jgi:hypothetical protein
VRIARRKEVRHRRAAILVAITPNPGSRPTGCRRDTNVEKTNEKDDAFARSNASPRQARN